jgi:hypothetical protein
VEFRSGVPERSRGFGVDPKTVISILENLGSHTSLFIGGRIITRSERDQRGMRNIWGHYSEQIG